MRTAPERQAELKGCDIFISWQLLVLIRSANEVFCAVAPRQPPFPAIIWIFITCFNEPCLQGTNALLMIRLFLVDSFRAFSCERSHQGDLGRQGGEQRDHGENTAYGMRKPNRGMKAMLPIILATSSPLPPCVLALLTTRLTCFYPSLAQR